MKKALGFGLAALLALGSANLLAGDRDHGKGMGMHGGPGMAHMSKYLELTPKQETELLELRHKHEEAMLKRHQEMRAAKQDGEEIDRAEMKAEMMENRAEMDKDLKDILTDEQWAKYVEKRDARMEKREKHMKDGDKKHGYGH